MARTSRDSRAKVVDVLKFLETDLPGIVLVEPQIHGHERGFFLEIYHTENCRERGSRESFVQDSHSRSSHGILRGLHAQAPIAQGKLLRDVRDKLLPYEPAAR
jgi:dTDP-4-dehydrorhamnose 3,5-epimerase